MIISSVAFCAELQASGVWERYFWHSENFPFKNSSKTVAVYFRMRENAKDPRIRKDVFCREAIRV
jgi:hypothetical protein